MNSGSVLAGTDELTSTTRGMLLILAAGARSRMKLNLSVSKMAALIEPVVVARSNVYPSGGAFTTASVAIEHIRAGKLRPLAVTSATRSEALPSVSTVGDFLPGYEASYWCGIVTPRNTPAEITDQQGNKCGPGRYQNEGAICRSGRHDAGGLAVRLQQARRPGNREVGQGGQVRGHQTGVISIDVP